MIDYGMTLMAGLLASMHCIGMCGVIVLAYASQPAAAAAPPVSAGLSSRMGLHAAYNGGRVLSYALLGAIAGLFGMAIGGVLRDAASYLAIGGGIVMIVAGAAMLGMLPLPATLSLSGTSPLMLKLRGSLIRRPTVGSKLTLGLLTPLLPCGIFYAMLAKATAAGSVLHGAATMGLFAVGMSPALMFLGGMSSVFSARFRTGAERLAAIMIVLMGVALLLRGFHIPYLAWLGGGHGQGDCCAH